jgi:hypothetical protein
MNIMNSPLPLKCIFRGKLELGNQRTFEKVKAHFQNRIETMYKSDIFYTLETEFKEDDFSITLPVATMQLPEKSYRKSMDLLKELAQYSLAGRILGWAIDSGRIVSEDQIVPNNQKSSVITYLEGIQLSSKPGNEEKAIEALTESINVFERNPLAYDRRGFISYKMAKYNDAIVDFEKSIAIFNANPEPYYGLGRCYHVKEDWANMMQHMQTAMRVSIPRQSIHHTAKLYYAIAAFHLGDMVTAKTELEAFIARNFAEDDHNEKKKFLAYKYLGKVQLQTEDPLRAFDSFNMAFLLAQTQDVTVQKSSIFPENMPSLIDLPKEKAKAPTKRKPLGR